MMKKSTLLYALLFYFLFIGWAITPTQAHIGETCLHKNPNHQHCDGSGGEGARTLEDLDCTTDQIPKFDGAEWGCAADTDTTAETECPDGHALLGDGSCVDVGAMQVLLDALAAKLGMDSDCVLDPPTSGTFVDNCDGTITDTSTGLMWEKKTDDAGIHDKDNVYSWSADGTTFDGTAATVFLATLNGVFGDPCFAGHCDWRLPKVSRGQDAGMPELETIADCSFGPPCIDPIFGPTVGDPPYWSATTNDVQEFAERVGFLDGIVAASLKLDELPVRAVRTIGP